MAGPSRESIRITVNATSTSIKAYSTMPCPCSLGKYNIAITPFLYSSVYARLSRRVYPPNLLAACRRSSLAPRGRRAQGPMLQGLSDRLLAACRRSSLAPRGCRVHGPALHCSLFCRSQPAFARTQAEGGKSLHLIPDMSERICSVCSMRSFAVNRRRPRHGSSLSSDTLIFFQFP